MSETETQVTPVALYVEDEECDREFMQMAFRGAGMANALRTVNDRREAINYLTGNGVYADRQQYPLPAIILLDLNLPIYHGFEVLRQIRHSPTLKRLPVVVFTSSSREQDRIEATALGADDFVEKPQSSRKFGGVAKWLKDRWLSGEADLN